MMNIKKMNMERTAVVIEDDYTIVYLLKQILKGKRIKSFPANSIKEGLELMHEKHPDFLFLDNELPDGLGFDNISAIHHDCPQTQIIAMTAQLGTDKKDETLINGASYFLGKPFTINQVYLSLKKYLPENRALQ
jgi:DNA-binding NtrC family response regulator